MTSEVLESLTSELETIVHRNKFSDTNIIFEIYSTSIKTEQLYIVVVRFSRHSRHTIRLARSYYNCIEKLVQNLYAENNVLVKMISDDKQEFTALMGQYSNLEPIIEIRYRDSNITTYTA